MHSGEKRHLYTAVLRSSVPSISRLRIPYRLQHMSQPTALAAPTTALLSPDKIWNAVLGELEMTISRANFTTWFKNTSILRYGNGEVAIAVPNMFTCSWLQNKYHKEISRALQNVTGERIVRITYELHSQAAAGAAIAEKRAEAAAAMAPATPASMPFVARTAPFSAVPSTATPFSGATPFINTKYSFENFVVGANNELARAAAVAVAKNPGTLYNPLFIYGGVGLGKTHLIQAIGNMVLSAAPATKVVYVTCERFTDDFIRYIQEAKGRSEGSSVFKQKYRSADVLIVDDIQFLGGKERTQEEFFHTFNELHQNNKQVIITSDRPPKAILHLEDRLISRFEGGMIADIGMPDFETRKAILRAKCLEKTIELPEDVLDYIAQHIQSNIRELEGAISRVLAHCEVNNVLPTQDLAKSVLSTVISTERKASMTPKKVLEIVSEFYHIGIDDLLAKNRKKEVVWPRQIAMYLMRSEAHTSYPSIGQHIGGRDHTTAIHAYEKVVKQLELDESLRQEIDLLRQKLYL